MCIMFEPFSKNYMIGSAYINTDSQKKVAEISRDQYKIIENIYKNRLGRTPLIKLPEDNIHIELRLNENLPSKTLKYPSDNKTESDFRSYLLAKPESVIHKISKL